MSFNAAVKGVRKAHPHLSFRDAARVVQLCRKAVETEPPAMEDVQEMRGILAKCQHTKCPAYAGLKGGW